MNELRQMLAVRIHGDPEKYCYVTLKKNISVIKSIFRGCLKLKNGNINEFVDRLHYGDELVFLYKGDKYFVQGFKENGVCTLYLDRWEPPADDYIWKQNGNATSFPVDDFLNARLWDGKTFWDVESEMEWVDS